MFSNVIVIRKERRDTGGEASGADRLTLRQSVSISTPPQFLDAMTAELVLIFSHSNPPPIINIDPKPVTSYRGSRGMSAHLR